MFRRMSSVGGWWLGVVSGGRWDDVRREIHTKYIQQQGTAGKETAV